MRTRALLVAAALAALLLSLLSEGKDPRLALPATPLSAQQGGCEGQQRSVPLQAGWNLVAYTGPTRPVEIALSDVLSLIESVWAWDAATQSWRAWFPSGLTFLNLLVQLEQDNAYWLRLRSAAVWTFPIAASGGAAAPLTDDFTPPAGAAVGPEEHGPWDNRLMTAVSADGITFTRTNQVITDQGDVPDIAVDACGRLYLYYVGWTVGGETNETVVAISDDGGSTWVYKRVILSGFAETPDPVDPDIQILPDGTFHLYLTVGGTGGDRRPATHYAEGTDGIHFQWRGVAFAIPDRDVLDPSTLRIGSTWHIFAGGAGPSSNWHGTSTDGTVFTFDGEVRLEKDGLTFAAANGISVEGGYRLYTFSQQPGHRIASFFSIDGVTWTPEPGYRLDANAAAPLERNGVKDPTVAQLADGSYLMVYVTGIP